MKSFIFDFFQTGGRKTALTAGLILLGLGLIVLFFPELLRLLLAGGLVAAGLPMVIYGLKDEGRTKPKQSPDSKENVRIIYPE